MRALPLLLLVACDGTTTTLPEPLSDCRTDQGDPFYFEGAEIDGDDLIVIVGYDWGCADHDFVLCWPEQTFAESDPVQVWLEVYHDAHGETCDGYEEGPRTFDLTPLKDAWIDAYQSTTGEISIHIEGETLLYAF